MNLITSASGHFKLKLRLALFKIDREIILAWSIAERDEPTVVFSHFIAVDIDIGGSGITSGIDGFKQVETALGNIDSPCRKIACLAAFTRESEQTIPVKEECPFDAGIGGSI